MFSLSSTSRVQGATLFRGFGGPCEDDNKGDPVVLYDQLAHRWVLTVLAEVDETRYQTQCVAVSESDDATGRYYRYEYAIEGVPLPDYPKIGLWPDAYYYSADPLSSKGLACALDRDAILDATPTLLTMPQLQCCLLASDPSHFRLLPSDLDGELLPQPGTPNFFVNLDLDAKALQIWRFHVDFANPLNSMFLGPFPISGLEPFEGYGCNSSTLLAPCVPQKGTSQTLWTLGTHVMHRLAYRQFDQHASLVVNHSVHVDQGTAPDRVGIRWYEIRDPNGTPMVYQQRTFAPDSDYRWMGSVATDRLGNIGAGYSVSGSDRHPSIAVTGRAWDDPTPGILRDEQVVVEGSGSQFRPDGKDQPDWGDYTSMSVDPVFDCDFWYTNQYLESDGVSNWKTHVFSFRFPNCTECVGDCNRDEVEVTVDELQAAINVFLGNRPLSDCFRADGNGSGFISGDEFVRMVDHALNGCPIPPTPTPLGGGPESASPSGGDTTALSGPVDLIVSDAAGFKEDPVSFSITLANGSDSVAAFTLDLVYRDDVITTPTCRKDPNQVPLFHGLSSSNPEPGRRRFLLIDTTEYPVPSVSDGVLLTCNATILSNAPFGASDLLLDQTTVSDGFGNVIPVTITNGYVTVLGGPSPTPTATPTPTPTPIIQSFSPIKDVGFSDLVPGGENCPHSLGGQPASRCCPTVSFFTSTFPAFQLKQQSSLPSSCMRCWSTILQANR